MLNKIKNEIKQINNNIDVLPKKNKDNRLKVCEYIDDNINKFNKIKELIDKEIVNRYNKILDIKSNDKLIELRNKKIDYELVKVINPNVNSYQKMNLDYLLYKLNHYYQDDLVHTNEVIFEIISKFNEVNIKLTAKDFNYSLYVNIYMNTLLSDKEDISDVFNKIYWQCPDLLTQISLNFRYLYYKNKKEIDYYYKKVIKKNEKINYYEAKYNTIYDEINRIQHNDKKYLIDLFINHIVTTNDFSETNIMKIKNNLLLDQNDSNNYNNLLLLEETLFDYKKYLDIEFIVNNIKELYSNKNSYKGLKENKLKEIKKLEKSLFKLNRKLTKKGLFKKKVNEEEVKLKINSLINELVDNYKELDSLIIKDDIYNNVNDQMSLLDYLRIVSENFIYLKDVLKENNNDIGVEEINNTIRELKDFLYQKDNSILSNIKLGLEKNVPRIISDRYKLCNFNVTEEIFDKDSIDSIIKNVNILLISEDLNRVGLNISDIDFIVNINKKK